MKYSIWTVHTFYSDHETVHTLDVLSLPLEESKEEEENKAKII